MAIKCVWEHNGTDSLLYAVDLPGAYARGVGREEALQKMRQELPQFLRWMGRELPPEELAPVIIQEKTSTLRIADADSDVLFESERLPLTPEEYAAQKALALRSAADFLALVPLDPRSGPECFAAAGDFLRGSAADGAGNVRAHQKCKCLLLSGDRHCGR